MSPDVARCLTVALADSHHIRPLSLPAVWTGVARREEVCPWVPVRLSVLWKHESYAEMTSVL